MTEPATTVLIAGAGPTGLTLACELARKGVPFRIVESSAGPQPGSRGKGIQPRTLEVMDDLGIADRLLASGRMAMPVRMTGPDGSVVTPDPVTFRGHPDIPYPASLIIAEWKVEELLRDLLGEFGGEVEFGSTLESFEQTEETVTAKMLTDSGSETITARWLVGCDGGHSVVRKGAGITFDGKTLDTVRMMIADLPVDGLDRDHWHMWRHPDGLVMLCPLPTTDLFQYQAALLPGQEADVSLANLQAVLDRCTGRSDLRLGAPSWTSVWRANIRLVDRYRVGRVLVAGDAAHIHSPAGGQGMNTGIQDAHNLGWKLAAVCDGTATDDLLDSYASERRPVAEHVLALSNERLRATLDQGRVPIKADANTMQLTIGYRGSPLAHDDLDDEVAVRSGDRFPDVPGLRTHAGSRRLFDLTRGGRFTLLRFGEASTPDPAPAGLRILHVVVEDRLPAADVVLDPDGRLRRAFGIGDGALVLLRPDGYIGAISRAGDLSVLDDLLALVS